MKNYLRYSLMMALFLLCGSSYAGTNVKFDFDANGKDLFGLPGESSSDAGDGDITEAKTAIIDGVTLTVSQAAEGVTNPNRIWSKSPKLRMYSGLMMITAPSGHNITALTFDQGKWNDKNTADSGTLSSTGWEGNAPVVIISIAGNTQFKSITVTIDGEGGDNPDDPNSKSLLDKFDFTSGTITDNGDQTVFEFAGKAPMGETGEKIDITGKMLFDFENNICTACKALVTFPSEVIAVLAEADAKANADKDGFASVERDGATLTVVSSRDFLGYSRILIKATLRLLIGAETMGLGILESPMSPSQANMLAGGLGADEVLDQDVYIKGKIANIKYEFSAQYGTATFFISADGKDEYTFQCYSVYTLENKPWVEGNTQIKVGDEVIICGKVTNFKGTTPETASKKAYIYSLNGVTKNEGAETPDPQPQVTTATCAEILAGADGTVYRVTGKCVEIANTTYGNWYLEDATGKVYIYGTLDAEGNTKNFASLGIEVGDEITVEGPRKTYKETVELVDVKVIEIKKGAAEGAQVWDFTKWSDATIANLKADAAASKTSGWSDVEKAADAEAGADPTEASKDNCFWSVAEPNADGTLSANGVVIEELKGLVWNSAYSVKRSLAIAVNYQKALSDYAGPAYLWLGGGKNKIPCFTIPGVKAGSTITMEVESHKASDARGVELYTGVDADNLVDAATKIGDSFTPKEKDTHSWTIDNDCDVIVYNTNGCHIYKIEIATGTGIQAVKTATVGNGYIYNLAGQRVDANYKGVVIKNGQKMIQK
jgi:hypothetical protein